MNVDIDPSWKAALTSEFDKPYFKDLTDFVKKEYIEHKCFPKGSEIFKAFELCPLHALKVVILGQDPYHGIGQAHGLCFSVRDGVAPPPSLINIFREIQEDTGAAPPKNGNLERWAQQGVLLLNATLTVRAHQAGSHQGKGWERFTDEVIKTVSAHGEGVVFMLWGGYAKQKMKLIDNDKNLILTSGHPSPLSANRGYWFGNHHFSKTNAYLKNNNKETILW